MVRGVAGCVHCHPWASGQGELLGVGKRYVGMRCLREVDTDTNAEALPVVDDLFWWF